MRPAVLSISRNVYNTYLQEHMITHLGLWLLLLVEQYQVEA